MRNDEDKFVLCILEALDVFWKSLCVPFKNVTKSVSGPITWVLAF